jgi:predicted GNAT family N-acyltransferase
MADFTVKKLDCHDDLSGFDCSKNDELKLNEFIHKEALAYQRDGLGITHLFYVQDKLVGFVTLAMGSVRKKSVATKFVNYVKVNVPALFLGRLAVDNSERGKGYGTSLLEWCFGFAEAQRSDVGCRFVTLVTKKGKRTVFYCARGFKKVKAPLREDLQMLCFDLVPKNKNN